MVVEFLKARGDQLFAQLAQIILPQIGLLAVKNIDAAGRSRGDVRLELLKRRFPEIDQWLEPALRKYYGGSSRKAVLASYRDALKRWRTMLAEPE